MPNPAIELLLADRRADGGWGAYPGLESRTESTALSVVALQVAQADDEAPAREAAEAGAGWLRTHRLPSGTWPIGPELDEPAWPTALALWAISYGDHDQEDVAPGGAWLLDRKGQGTSWWVRLLYRLAPDRRPVTIDPDLQGWPWVGGTFSWVEPTAYAVIALRRLRAELPAGRVSDRIDVAERLFADRVCTDGGWNYGNKRVFDEDLPSYPDTTAAALIALAGTSGPLIDTGVATVERQALEHDSLLALAMASVAIATHAGDTGRLRARIGEKLDDYVPGETRALAWAAIALDERTDPLGLVG